MEELNLILGNSLTAKIFAFYNREYKIIGKNVSLVADPILKNMIFLQDNIYNRMFLQDLISISKEKIFYSFKNVDVLNFNGMNYTAFMSEEDKLKLINKKLTSTEGEKLNFKNKVFQDKIILAEEKNNILKIIEVDFDEITKAINKVIKDQIIDETEIIKINIADRLIATQNNFYYFKDCINTLNLSVFAKLAGIKIDDLNTLPTTTIEGTEELFGIPEISYENAIVYFPQEQYEFSKIVKRNNKCYAEITGTSKKFIGGSLMKGARLIKKDIWLNTKNIINLGRHAEWNPDIKLQDVIRRSSNKNVMQNIWQDQKEFSSKFFNMEQDLTIMQKNIKECSMLMMQEIFDLLAKINWKNHAEEKKLNLEEIKEELIDVYKYWLTIFVNLGLTFEDFIDAYEKKGIKLKEKYKK